MADTAVPASNTEITNNIDLIINSLRFDLCSCAIGYALHPQHSGTGEQRARNQTSPAVRCPGQEAHRVATDRVAESDTGRRQYRHDLAAGTRSRRLAGDHQFQRLILVQALRDPIEG